MWPQNQGPATLESMHLPAIDSIPTRLSYTGRATALTRIFLRNLLLGILTLGLYAPRGRVHTRRYVWQHVAIGDAPLQWLGSFESQYRLQTNGGQFLFGLWLTWLTCQMMRAMHVGSPWLAHAFVPVLLGLVSLMIRPFLQYSSRGYQLSETSWRGVTCGLDGDRATYARIYLTGYLWTLVTLGFGYGSFAVRTRAYLINNSRWGDQSFQYQGSVGEVRRLYVLGTLACVLTLGAYLPWHIARLRHYHGSKTTLGPLQLRIFQEGSGLSNLWMQNLCIYLGTLGLGAAWAKSRSLRYQMEHMALLGPLEALQPGPGPQGPKDGLIDFISMGGDRLLGA